MTGATQSFYDELAPYYHLIFRDWKRTVVKQGQVLDGLVRLRKVPRPRSVLDCSCGIGTQAIGLALHGYDVHGTDVSPQAVGRAQREAAGFGVSATFGVADFRALDAQVLGTFDLVISCDNALPHCLTRDDLLLAAESMWAKLKGEGLLLVSIRDYNRLLHDKPRATMPDVYDDGKRIVFQVWNWRKDGVTYGVDYFILSDNEGQWETFHQTMVYRALPKGELIDVLRAVGFSDIRWHTPEETGYFQPIVTAFRMP
jgi:glycine/sarcosine N-methyltransferase